MKGRYIILKADSHTDLADLVNEWIANGWEPVGGVAVEDKHIAEIPARGMFSKAKAEKNFYQAMLKSA